jgi:predicted O-methyltransferase YrrM
MQDDMNAKLSRIAESFVKNIAGANDAEISTFLFDFRQNQQFKIKIKEKEAASNKNRRSFWNYGIGESLGMILYIICRMQRPDIVVETGVSSGISSSYILCALEQNKRGQLYSIDLPGWQDSQSGWIIPDYLRHRWHLIVGKSSEKLGPLIEKVSTIDIFLHDSDHSYQNMLWEFKTAWKSLKEKGLLLAHNIDYNEVFSDFCRDESVKGWVLDDFGGIVKI